MIAAFSFGGDMNRYATDAFYQSFLAGKPLPFSWESRLKIIVNLAEWPERVIVFFESRYDEDDPRLLGLEALGSWASTRESWQVKPTEGLPPRSTIMQLEASDFDQEVLKTLKMNAAFLRRTRLKDLNPF